MQALSNLNYKIRFCFTIASELVENINYVLQKITYEHKKIKQDTKKDEILDEDYGFVREEFDEASALEQEVADVIIENKKKRNFLGNTMKHIVCCKVQKKLRLIGKKKLQTIRKLLLSIFQRKQKV